MSLTDDGLQEQYLDSIHPSENASHHYAGLFFAGYYLSELPGVVVNIGRDGDFWNKDKDNGVNPGDINLVSGAKGAPLHINN